MHSESRIDLYYSTNMSNHIIAMHYLKNADRYRWPVLLILLQYKKVEIFVQKEYGNIFICFTVLSIDTCNHLLCINIGNNKYSDAEVNCIIRSLVDIVDLYYLNASNENANIFGQWEYRHEVVYYTFCIVQCNQLETYVIVYCTQTLIIYYNLEWLYSFLCICINTFVPPLLAWCIHISLTYTT